MGNHPNLNKVSAAGLIIALGIIYGDIGTSPLYVMNEITKGKFVTKELIYGALSLIIWTLTLQTTIKYVLLTLKADNKGEGGIFSLYTLVRRQKKWLVIPAMIGGAALLADGMITPPISVASAVEGLKVTQFFEYFKPTSLQFPPTAADALAKHVSIEELTTKFNESIEAFYVKAVVIVVLIIIALLFFMQQFGTASIGKMFGPIMAIWFGMLALLGVIHLSDDLSIFHSFNPYYGIKLLITYPHGFWILGAVFLCTTGAEALYSDLGHCGRKNIRVSWIFVKCCLILNYLGQGAYLLKEFAAHHDGNGAVTKVAKEITHKMIDHDGFNPFLD